MTALASALMAAVMAPSARADLAVDPPIAAAADTMRLAVNPLPALGATGDTLLVELKVPEIGPAFNAYDAYLTYDPAILRFLPAANVGTQEGPLMTEACGLRFHVFAADTLAGRLRISHSLMCSGRSVTGPGVVYRVRFRCRDVDADTPLSLLVAAPHRTAFYLAGELLVPLVTTGAVVRVGAGSTTAVAPPRVGAAGLIVTPNPFNPRAEISFDLQQPGVVAVDVYAVDGRPVRALWRGDVPAGPWRRDWDGRDDADRPVASGVYVVRVRTANGSLATRATLLR